MKRARALVLATISLLPASTLFADDSQPFSFVVLGHVRGDPTEPKMQSGLLGEITDRCRRLKPDVVVLTGDMIWGLAVDDRPKRDQVLAEWTALDAQLDSIGAPVLRTPGNHDINDLTTRDLFFERYRRLPFAVTHGRCRLIVLASDWIPEDGYVGPEQYVRGKPLDDAQLDFLKKELADDKAYDHAFVFMAQMLWWDKSDPWMQRVHPALKGTKLRAVFSGDYGPKKYTHVVRDGIRYIQTAVETEQDLDSIRRFEKRRLLNAQMDMFARVVVEGADVRYEMVPVGVTTTERYTPERWAYIDRGLTFWERLYDRTLAASRSHQIALLGAFVANVCLGVLIAVAVGRVRRRRQAARRP